MPDRPRGFYPKGNKADKYHVIHLHVKSKKQKRNGPVDTEWWLPERSGGGGQEKKEGTLRYPSLCVDSPAASQPRALAAAAFHLAKNFLQTLK